MSQQRPGGAGGCSSRKCRRSTARRHSPPGGIRGDRLQRVPALPREVPGRALDLAGAAMTDGAQAQRAARLVDAAGLELDAPMRSATATSARARSPRPPSATAKRPSPSLRSATSASRRVDVVAADLGLADEVRHEAAVGGRVEQHAARRLARRGPRGRTPGSSPRATPAATSARRSARRPCRRPCRTPSSRP